MSQGFTSQLPVPLPVAQGGTGVTTSTGTGDTVLSTSPTLTTPRIGQINDINGNASLTTTATPSAVNYINCVNNVTGYYPNFSAAGTDTNIDFAFNTKGTGVYRFISSAPTSPFVIYNGTGNQHNTTFAFSNTAASQTVTFPDLTGTVQLSSNTGSAGQVLTSNGAGVAPSFQNAGASTGRLIAIRTLTGSGTYTATAGTNSCWVQCVSGGGGGGAATALASQTSCGAGGGGGGYCTKYYSVVPTGTAYSVGAGGAAGTSGAGGNGGNTTFNAGDMNVAGGSGGAGMTTSTATQAVSVGGASGYANIGDNSDLKVQGTKGYPGMVLLGSSSIGVSGQGGQPGCGFGPAPYSTTNTVAGNPASPGVGGCGAFQNGAGSRNGGPGGAGTIIVWEYS